MGHWGHLCGGGVGCVTGKVLERCPCIMQHGELEDKGRGGEGCGLASMSKLLSVLVVK